MTPPPATSGPSAPDPTVVNALQASAPPKKRPTGLIVLMIILALLLIGIIGWLALVNGEYLCLDRRPGGGLPRTPSLYELFRAHRRVASEVGLGLLGPAARVVPRYGPSLRASERRSA